MEDIEYLEEYEDLVLPALNSAAASASTVSSDTSKSFTNLQNQKVNDDGDDSSSSLDQDIFNCLFDDNSDDDDEDDYNTYEQGGEKNIKEVEVLRQDQKSEIYTFAKEDNKITSSTPKPKTLSTKTSTTTISIDRAEPSFVNKPKSVATVRPTVQNQLYQTKQKKTSTVQRSTTSFVQQQQQQRQQTPTTSTASTSRSHQLPVLARKPLSTAAASTSTFGGKKITLPSPSLKTNTLVKKVAKRPATIVKPEKIITKDPVNDPLNLDDLSEIGSDNYSLSDISGETYNSISEFDDDDSNDEYYSGDNVAYYEDADDDNISSSSQIIELSNDSSGSQTKLEDLRAPTPSPVISDDSDTSSSLFNSKLREPCSTKPYSHPIIIQSVLKKGDKPKLLELLSQYNLLDDSVENDSEEEANIVIDITKSKENLLESLDADTVQRASSPPTLVAANPATGCSIASDSTDKNKSKKKRFKKMDRTNANRDSTDSDLSAVEELLEESYAEAMKKIKDAPLSSQEVGAELEIGGEEEVAAVEIIKTHEVNKPKQTKTGIVIDYEHLEQESVNLTKEDNTSKKELETKPSTAEEEIESINKEIEKEIEREIEKEIGRKGTELEKIESSEKPSKELKNKEIADTPEISSLKPTTNNEDSASLNEITDKPITTSSKPEDIVKEEDPSKDPKASKDNSKLVETITTAVSHDSLNVRKKKRFRNLKTPEPSNPSTAADVATVKSLDDVTDFEGFEDGEKHAENVQKFERKVVNEQALKKSLESNTNKIKDDSSGSFKSPTSSHKSLQDKHRETKEKISSRDSSRDSSKDHSTKETKSKSSRESSRENSKDRSSRESSKDRSRERSKDRTKALVKDYKDHRKSNDSKESSRSRESSKSRDSKDIKHTKSDAKELQRHSTDKKDKTQETTKEKFVDKTKTFGTDQKGKKDNEPKKYSKDDKELAEKTSDTVKPKKLTGDVNKAKVKEGDNAKASNIEKLKGTPTKDFKNANIQKKSTDSPSTSSSKNSSLNTSRDSSKDRRDVKKPMEPSTKTNNENKKSEGFKKSNESFDRNKASNVTTLPGNKMISNKPTPTKIVSNSNEKQKDKINPVKKSSDLIKDCKSVKSDTKSVKDNNDFKTQTPKSSDFKSGDSNIKNIKPNLIVKTATQSPNTKPINKSNTNLNKSNTSLNRSNTSLNKSSTSLNKSNTSLNKSNTSLDKITQKPSDSKSNKDLNSKTGIKPNVNVKNPTPKPTILTPDKSNISKSATISDANKTPKKLPDDKNVSLQQRDKIVNQNKKSSSDAVNKTINKKEDTNKNLGTETTSKTINKIEVKNKPTKVQVTPETPKDTKIIPTATKSAAENTSNIKKPSDVVETKSVTKNVKDGAKLNIVNKSANSPLKKVIQKPDENKQKEKTDICRREDLLKQDLKPILKTTSEKPQSKEMKNISEGNDKTDTIGTMSPKKDVKPKPVITKAKAEVVQKKSEPAKIRNPAELKSVNAGLKKLAETKPVSGEVQVDKNIPKTETKEKKEAEVKNKTETIKTIQSKETKEVQSETPTDAAKINESEKCLSEKKKRDTEPNASNKPDLKLKSENQTDSVKSNESEKNSTGNKEEIKSKTHITEPEEKPASENQADSTKTDKSKESSKGNETKTKLEPKPAVSKSEIKCKSENQIDLTKTAKSKENSKEKEMQTKPKPVVSEPEIKLKSENKPDSTEPTKAEESSKLNEKQIKPKPAVNKSEIKSKSENDNGSTKANKTQETSIEIKPQPRASEPHIKVKILKSRKISANSSEVKADSIKESSKLCDKKETETKTSKVTKTSLNSSSSSGDKEVETKQTETTTQSKNLTGESKMKATLATANVDAKTNKNLEITSSKKDDLELLSSKTPKITNKKEEKSPEEDNIEVKKCNEIPKQPTTNVHAEKKVITKELLEESNEKQELPTETEETIEPRITRSRVEITKAAENIHEKEEKSPKEDNIEVKKCNELSTKPTTNIHAEKKVITKELLEESNEKQELPTETEETIEPRITRSRVEITKAAENIHEKEEKSPKEDNIEVKKCNEIPTKPTTNIHAEKKVITKELLEESNEKQELPTETEETIEPRITRSRVEITKAAENIHEKEEKSPKEDNIEVKKCNEIPTKPTSNIHAEKKVITKELLEESNEKQELPTETEETIEPRITRSRMEITKAAENIHEPITSTKCSDLKLKSKENTQTNEAEELQLKANKSEHDKKIDISETAIDRDIKADHTLVELNEAKNLDKKYKDNAKQEDIGLKEEKEKVEQDDENNSDKNKLKEVEPMRTRNRSKILIDDVKSPCLETDINNQTIPSLVDAKDQISNVKAEDLKLEESETKEKESGEVVKTEDVSSDKKFESTRTRSRAENKSDTKVKEGQTAEHSQSEIICENTATKLRDQPECSIVGIRTRKRMEMESDEKKLIQQVGVSEIRTESLEVEKKSTTEEAKKTDGDHFTPIRTRKRLELKIEESTTNMEHTEEIEKSNEPMRTRKRGDVKTDDSSLKETTEISGEDKKDSKDQTNKELRSRQRGDIIQSADVKEKDSLETSDKGITEPIKTRNRGEAVKSTDLNQKQSIEISVDDKKGPKGQTNKELIEPIKTRKRREVANTTDLGLKESIEKSAEVDCNLKELTDTSKTDNEDTNDQTNKEIIETDIIQSADVKEKDSLETSDKGITEPIKTRNRGEAVKSTDLNQKQSTEISVDDKKGPKGQTNKELIEPIKTRKRREVANTTDLGLKESIEKSAEVDFNLKELTDTSKTDNKDTKDQTNKEIIETDIIQSADVKEKDSLETPDKGITEPIKTRNRGEAMKSTDLNQKQSTEISVDDKKGPKGQTNKELIEPIKTRKRREVANTNDLGLKESIEKSAEVDFNLKELTETSKTDNKDTKDQTNKEIIETVKTRKRGEAVKAAQLNQKKATETCNEDKETTKDETSKEINEPIKTRSRGDVKASDLNKLEVLETSGSDKNDTKDQINKEMIEPVTTIKPTEVQTSLVSQNTRENKLEHIRTRKDDDLKEQTKEGAIEEKNIIRVEKPVVDKTEPIRTRSRTDNKADDLKVIKEKCKEAGGQQHLPTNDNDQSKQDSLDQTETIETSSDTTITSDISLKRILRKRGTESPLPENDNKKSFKEPPTAKSAFATLPKIAKDEKLLTAAVGTSLKRSLRSPVSETTSPITVKRLKLDVPRKTTRFRNLHDDCLEEEELPVITASDSVITTELENLNVEPKELEVQEKHQLPRKSIRKEPSHSKNIESKSDQESNQNVITDREKTTAETEIKKLPRTEVKEIEADQSNSVVNLKAKLISKEVSNTLENNEKQNTPEQSKLKKAKPNTTPTNPLGSSSVLSFSDWLKSKKESTKVDDDLENNSLESTTTKEKSSDKTKANFRIKLNPITKVVDIQGQNKPSEDPDKQESSIENTQEEEKETMAKDQDSINATAYATRARKSKSKIDSISTANNNQSKAVNPNATTTASTSKISQPDVQDDSSCDSKVKMEKLQAPTPTLTKAKTKKREIDQLIESMSKEMKDGGINDLLNAETHVKRQRLATKRIFTGSSEHLNTSSNITTKETTAVVTSATTAGTVLSKEVPKVIEFAESTELLASSPKEFNKSPNKRKSQQNTTKSTKATGQKNTTDYDHSSSDMKSRKSLNLKDLASHNTRKEALSPSITIKLTKLLPTTKETNVVEKIPSGKEGNTTHIKGRKTEQSNIPEKGVNKNISPIFKTPKAVVHSTVFNTITDQERFGKLHVEDNKRPQSRNKKTSQAVTTFKCRKVKVRLNRSKVKKYLKVLNESNNQVTATSGKTLEEVRDPTGLVENSSIIQNNADSNLRIQPVADMTNLMDLSTDYSPNNLFIPQDSFAQTNLTSDTMQLPSDSLANQSYAATPISDNTLSSLRIINAADPSEHIELKNEFLDENPIDMVNEALLPDTPTLLARAQTITEAAQHALSHSIAPTDIRLLTTESTGHAFVPSFGVTPTALDNRGTCMYTFLHPAKYNRNHSNVLLDYCCPNLDGPMPAIDPTRIHAQVQVPVIELPASIVLTTKIVTRADLESENSTVPAIIRRKAEKIRNNLAAHHKVATAATVASTTQQPSPYINSVMQPQSSTTRFPLPPTINALTKQLPATTTITAKIRPTQHQDVVAQSHPIPNQTTTSSSSATPINAKAGMVTVIPKGPPQLSQLQKSTLRSNLRRFDVLLKQLVQPFDNLTFADRHRIIEAIIATGKLLPKDLDRTIILMEEYIKQTSLINNNKNQQQNPQILPAPLSSATTTISTNNYHMITQSANSSSLATMQMPKLQPSPQLLAPASATTSAASSYCRQQLEQMHKKTVKKVQTSSSTAGAPVEGTVVKQRQVPIYDAERNIIGYQMKMLTPMASIPAYTKSTMSTHTGAIMSTSLDSSSNKTISYTVSKRPIKRPAQDSPRVFFTTPPLQTSTPKGITNPTHLYPATHKESANSKAIAQKTQKGSIVTALRSSGSTTSNASSETITTTTMATVKRVTRSTATGSKIIIVSKSNQSSEETILPDSNNQQQPEIKNEKDIEEFLG